MKEQIQQEYKDEPIEHISPKESKDDNVEDDEESKHAADELITEKIEIGKFLLTCVV